MARVAKLLALLAVVAAGALSAAGAAGAPGDVPGAMPASAAGARTAGVAAFDGRGDGARPCGPITVDGDEGTGGCAFQTVLEKATLTIRTLAGDMPFGTRCTYNYEVHVDGAGRTALTNLIVVGPNPCSDVRYCYNREQTERLAWRGRIEREADGRLIHRVQMCVDSCFGQFKGEMTMRLERHPGGWRAVADDASAGTSGFTTSASWNWGMPGLDLRPAAGG